MRTDNATFAAVDQSLSKEPRYVIELDFAGDGTDLVYFTSHADCLTPDGATVYASTLKRAPSGTTQRLIREEGRSEIGRISFQLVDVAEAVSTLIRTKEQAGFGVRHKRVRVYRGYRDPSFTEWAHYVLVDTQIVDDLAYHDGAYDVRCSDVQRTLRKEVFDLATTNITATVSATATTIPVRSTAAFEQLQHDAGYSDAPGQKVGYFRLDEEVIRYTGKTATEFTGCTRGALNTKAAEHAITAGAEADRQPEVTEVVYLEGPGPQLAIEIMTGAVYGQPGETLPDGWHLAVPAEYVSTASFENIGSDLWDTSNPATGGILRFVGEQRQDGKRFIESQICAATSTYLAVLSDGALALRRRSAVLAGASHIAVLDASNTTKVGKLQHDLGAVQNRYIIDWNYDAAREETTRTNILYDAVSEAIHGRAEPRRLELRGLYGGRVTDELLLQRFRSWTDAYAHPAERLTVTLHHRANRLEVGDIVRVQYDHVRDAAGSGGSSIDRAMEIQRVAIDWQSGAVSVDLMGSTAPGNAQSLTQAASILPDDYYAAQGTNLATYAGVSITVTGGVGHITGGTGLAAGTYYYLGDLQLDAGVTLPINGHVTLYVMGYLTVNGTLDGKGRGYAGQEPEFRLQCLMPYHPPECTFDAMRGNVGIPGVGKTRPETGLYHGGGFFGTLYEPATTSGTEFADGVPPREVRYENGAIHGLPTDLRGTSGGAGGQVQDGQLDLLALGGRGGNSGAGIVIVSRGGDFGADGHIDVSGDDGALGSTWVGSYNFGGPYTFAAGAGAGGAAGGVLWVVDGGSVPPDITHVRANHGATPLPPGAQRISLATSKSPPPAGATLVGYYPAISASECADANAKIVYLAGATQPAADVPTTTDDAIAITAAVYLNVPESPRGNLCTIEASVTAPAAGNYAYSNVYIREANTDNPWALIGPTAPEATLTVTADGTTYELLARSVSRSGVESPSGPTTTLTVPNVTAPDATDTPPSDLLVVPSVTGLELEGQGNETEFVGPDAHFAWRAVAVENFYQLGSEPTGLGLGAGTLDSYFRDYRVQVFDGDDNLLRTEYATEPHYTYTLGKNIEDYTAQNGSAGSHRSFRIEVVIRCHHTTEVSPRVAKLTVSNPAPGLGTAIAISALTSAILFSATPPTDHDLSGLVIWLSESTGFTPAADNIAYNAAPAARVSLGGLKGGTQYYLRYAYRDAFADVTAYHDGAGLNVSGEYTVTTAKASAASEIADLSNWATRLTPADLAFIEANLGLDAIPSTRIESLVASKIAAGTMAAKVGLAGVFIAAGTGNVLNDDGTGLDPGDWRLDMGPVTDGGTTYIQRYHDGNGNVSYALREDGGFKFGIGDDDYLQFDLGTGLSLGPRTRLIGADAYANNSIYVVRDRMDDRECDITTTFDGSVVTSDYGVLKVSSGTSGDAAARLMLPTFSISTITWGKVRRWKARVIVDLGGRAIFGTGDTNPLANGERVVFHVDETGNVSGWVGNDSGLETLSLSTTIADGSDNLYELVFVPGAYADFYINDVFKGRITTRLPSGFFSATWVAAARAVSVSGAQSVIYLPGFKFLQEE